MIDSLSIAVHAFVSRVSMSCYVERLYYIIIRIIMIVADYLNQRFCSTGHVERFTDNKVTREVVE